jgi:hypothetical protein
MCHSPSCLAITPEKKLLYFIECPEILISFQLVMSKIGVDYVLFGVHNCHILRPAAARQAKPADCNCPQSQVLSKFTWPEGSVRRTW